MVGSFQNCLFWFCSHCSKPISPDEKSKHPEICPAKDTGNKKCARCRELYLGTSDHFQKCLFRYCDDCSTPVSPDKKQEHPMICPTKDIGNKRCARCRKSCPKKSYHFAKCPFWYCRACHKPVPLDEKSKHPEICPAKGTRKKTCCRCRKFYPKKSDHFAKCPFWLCRACNLGA